MPLLLLDSATGSMLADPAFSNAVRDTPCPVREHCCRGANPGQPYLGLGVLCGRCRAKEGGLELQAMDR